MKTMKMVIKKSLLEMDEDESESQEGDMKMNEMNKIIFFNCH